MNTNFLDAALDDLDSANEYYETRLPGLGTDFVREMTKTVGRIELNPNAWPKATTETRKAKINRFPYHVVYELHKDSIRIVAVMHEKRHPDTWKNRQRTL